MSEDKETYGKPNCRHEDTTPIVNLPGVSRCDKCGEVMRPKRTRYEWLRSLSVEGLADELPVIVEQFDNVDYCKCECDDDYCPHPKKCLAIWLMEEVE